MLALARKNWYKFLNRALSSLLNGMLQYHVPSWSGAVILGRCVQPGLVCRRQVAAAVGKQPGTHRAAHKDHDRSEGLCRGRPGHLEQPPRRPADFIAVQRYICEKT